ncbi:hypothetical protein ASZ78_000357 [Callipepla squamata]|uniref:Cystatin LXN-type domain-containing protein n=1 Tax=Callipepla squamata TaxID=9009 RepID=A0A226N6B3_CALSU|nr:hypothetical protein ASZ78_000357 [Callipepla squamata]
MFALNPNSRQASRAAWVALHYSNYHGASPSGLRALRHVMKVSAKMIADVGVKYYLQFATEDYISGQETGNCFATVLYQKKSKPEVNIKCARTQDQKQIQEEDRRVFQYLRHQTKPITANKIPDSHGNIEHALLPVWALAVAGSSHIMLDKSKENVGYFLAQIRTAKQWIRKDGAVEFEYTILLHKTPTQEMDLCYMNVLWSLHQVLTAKYICASESHQLDDGSGQEFGSAAETLHKKGGNFLQGLSASHTRSMGKLCAQPEAAITFPSKPRYSKRE